jgi:hypothetical protein
VPQQQHQARRQAQRTRGAALRQVRAPACVPSANSSAASCSDAAGAVRVSLAWRARHDTRGPGTWRARRTTPPLCELVAAQTPRQHEQHEHTCVTWGGRGGVFGLASRRCVWAREQCVQGPSCSPQSKHHSHVVTLVACTMSLVEGGAALGAATAASMCGRAARAASPGAALVLAGRGGCREHGSRCVALHLMLHNNQRVC